jgi:transmembrane sensor
MRETAQKVEVAATEWVVRIDRGLTLQEREALERWLGGDTRRAGALARVQAVLVQTHRARVCHNDMKLGTRSRFVFRNWVWPMAAAATLIVGLLGAFLGWQSYARHHFNTTVGEIRAIPLEDGSRLTLDTATQVALSFQHSTRVIRLESGMALFTVAKDPSRPFVVIAGHTRVRALGTAFVVRRRSEDNVEVTVTEGTVDVWRETSSPEPAVRLTAGSRTQSTPVEVEEPQSLTNEQLAGATAWQDGMIDLNRRSLAEAAQEFNRYNRQVLVIEDPRLAAQTVVGRFRADNPVAFVNAAAAMMGAQVRIDGDRLILEPRLKE